MYVLHALAMIMSFAQAHLHWMIENATHISYQEGTHFLPEDTIAECTTGKTNAVGYVYVDVFTEFGAPVENHVSDVDKGGNFLFGFDGYPDRSYRLYGHALGSLRKRIDIAYVGATGLRVDFSLKFGDVDQDGFVTQSEVAYIFSQIGIKDSDIRWLDYTGDMCPALCDFDQDGTITIADYNLASPNVGCYGD